MARRAGRLWPLTLGCKNGQGRMSLDWANDIQDSLLSQVKNGRWGEMRIPEDAFNSYEAAKWALHFLSANQRRVSWCDVWCSWRRLSADDALKAKTRPGNFFWTENCGSRAARKSGDGGQKFPSCYRSVVWIIRHGNRQCNSWVGAWIPEQHTSSRRPV